MYLKLHSEWQFLVKNSNKPVHLTLVKRVRCQHFLYIFFSSTSNKFYNKYGCMWQTSEIESFFLLLNALSEKFRADYVRLTIFLSLFFRVFFLNVMRVWIDRTSSSMGCVSVGGCPHFSLSRERDDENFLLVRTFHSHKHRPDDFHQMKFLWMGESSDFHDTWLRISSIALKERTKNLACIRANPLVIFLQKKNIKCFFSRLVIAP